MALATPLSADRKRVKVYELKNNDWFDRGTGFCVGVCNNEEARVHVQSEDEPDRTLLETRITRDDGYQKQQDTLIVWTEQGVTDMALSFQEAEGCAAIWEFVTESQQKLGLINGVDDGLSDDIIEPAAVLSLPDPDMSNLDDIEATMRAANNTPHGREGLARFIVNQDYIAKLVPLVEMAEDFESLADLHKLCNIMKTIILLNDNSIMEQAVRDEVVLGVVGALEYDPDFPSHKANHRTYLADPSRFKQVVTLEDRSIEQKIHHTYRLQYLKDVVLARIIDDPTFSVLNSLIYFNQIEIVQHIQTNVVLLKELFGSFRDPSADAKKKKNAVLFIQQCCSIAKNIQQPGRTGLFNNFVTAGLFHVITFALKHHEAQIRVAGTEILIALIDHDNQFLRSQIFKSLNEGQKPLTDTLIELLLQEPDLGVKAQMADAIKILLDPILNIQSMEHMSRSNPDYAQNPKFSVAEMVQKFYDDSANKLFAPLTKIRSRESMSNLTSTEASLYAHLVESLTYFLRQHSHRTKTFLQANKLNTSVAQLFKCPEKFLQLAALKYFRSCIAMNDQWHWQQMINNRIMEPILDTMLETMPKDNLMNSACLDLFEFVRRAEHLREMIIHLLENFRQKLEELSYMETFKVIINKYEQITAPVPDELSFTTVETESAPHKAGLGAVNGRPYQGLREDPDEEAYFNGEEADDEEDQALSPIASSKTLSNGSSPSKPLVDYPDDNDDEDELALDPVVVPSNPIRSSKPGSEHDRETSPSTAENSSSPPDKARAPPDRLAEKRRREADDEDDELGRLVSQPPKRRLSGVGPTPADSVAKGGHTLRRKKGMSITDGKKKEGKIAIQIAVKAVEGHNGDS